jgi:hypothetical protein
MATIEAQSHLTDRETFLASFSSQKVTIYYRGASLVSDCEKNAEYARFRDWIWRHVIDAGRGTLVQRRLGPAFYEYLAIPRREKVDSTGVRQ